MLGLHQKLAQTQKLSPQQIQYQKLLQLNTLSLEQRIKTELEQNPILEELEEMEQIQEENEPDKDLETGDAETEASETEDFDVEDMMNEGEKDEAGYSNYGEEEKTAPIPRDRESLSDRLLEQLHLQNISEEETVLGEAIIENLSPNGYLKTDLEKIATDLELFEHISLTHEQAEKVLRMIQRFEPLGIAARNLRECLLIQLRNLDYDPYYSYLAERIIENHFDDFKNKRFEAIQKNMNLTKETLRTVLEVIHKLDPKPGEGNILSEQANQITPDFFVEKMDNNFIVTLNDRNLPSVTLSKTYLEMLNAKKRKRKLSKQQKETHKFLREKFESAKWFIASIQQRRHTLLNIMQTIVEKQYEFFEYGPRALKPMIYRDVADEIGMDISTISRVVNGKFVQSPVGIHELKYFFSEGLSTDSGDEISNKHIKELIKEIVDKESKNKPFSDDKIAKMLTEKGIHIARRTVAKYREQLKIPVARLRKEL
ncbi:MAG: RNA polymerase factor sigma-54 [Chlorobi bacterium]|nr:RNA polymerase factor sigma-54 [Chlorobiota bacterium]